MEEVEVVLGAGQLGVDDGLGGRVPERAHEPAGVFHEHHRVERPVDDEERWRAVVDVRDG